MQPILRVTTTTGFSHREHLVVVVLIVLMSVDDLVFSAYLSDINNYPVIYGAPEIPWAGAGWFNPHLLILVAFTS